MTRFTIILALGLACSAQAGKRAAQTFDGVRMAASPIPLPETITSDESASYGPVPLLADPAPHEVTLELFQDGNVLKHVVEEAPTPAGPWEMVAVRWNDYIASDTTFRVTFTSQRNPAFWRIAASNTP